MPGESCRIPLSVSVPLHGEEHVQLEILTDSKLTPTVTIPIRLVAGEPKTPILLTMDRSLTLRGSETGDRSKNFVVKTLEREGAAPWITSVMVDRQELTAQIVDTSETRMSEHPGVVMRDYVLQARRTDAADAPQSVVCRISFHSQAVQPPTDFVCDVLLTGADHSLD